MNQIHIINGGTWATVNGIAGGTVRDAIDTDNTISLTVYKNDVARITTGTGIEFAGQYYDVITCQKYMNGGVPFADITAENILYRANDIQYNYKRQVGINPSSLSNLFSWWCTPGDINAAPFTVFTLGLTDLTSVPYAPAFYANVGETRRAVLNRIAVFVGAEIEVSGHSIHFWKHRGSAVPVELLNTDAVDDVRESTDYRTGKKSYTIKLLKNINLEAGDELHLKFTPLGIDVNTRIIGIEYDPYDPMEVSIDVGDYEPDIKDLLV
jgi:hypothetical protein